MPAGPAAPRGRDRAVRAVDALIGPRADDPGAPGPRGATGGSAAPVPVDLAAWAHDAARVLEHLREHLVDHPAVPAPFDPGLADALLGLLRPLRGWFRLAVTGLEHIPREGPALLVANHGGAVPLDALMTQLVVRDGTGRWLRILAGSLAFDTPVVAGATRALGHVRADRGEAEALLARGELVGVWPEGYAGLGKPVRERYRLRPLGHGGFAAVALRSRVPLIPVAIVGAEEAYPVMGDLAPLAAALGLPYLPVTATFPWLGPLGLVPLPSRWRIAVGEPVLPGDGDPDDPVAVLALADAVRDRLRAQLDAALAARGPAY